jgi:lauroyl/myristoyl acyltransferase
LKEKMDRNESSAAKPSGGAGSAGPSVFYRAGLWRAGLGLARVLPAGVLDGLCRAVAEGYYRTNRIRREVVERNLEPVFQGDRAKARQAAHRLFQHFAVKLADLWRFESGVPIDRWPIETRAWEHFAAARARGRGVLLITPHLGNWELGAPLLGARGVPLLVITQAEPGGGFTELRRASRAQWGIETLVIREDAFAFLEVIRRLQEGATVALLIDRPPPPSAVKVELFGRSFCASIAAAELARATGCALLGVCVTHAGPGYTAEFLPEFSYDRRSLGDRPARQQLTQQLLRAFEPWIRAQAEQWYHFVPIWPEASASVFSSKA